VSTTAARITWLLADPKEREAYATERVADDNVFTRLCLRCGVSVYGTATGNRTGYVVKVRDRGSKCRNVEVAYIHRGCIPRAGEAPQRIGARRLPT
jgi:hypothetical protein